MPDEPFADLSDIWGQALDADPATRRRGVPSMSEAPVEENIPLPPPQPAKGAAIAATAAQLAGRDGAGVRSFLQQNGQDLDPTRNNWCAAYVNGVLTANGVQGTTGPGRNIATGFLNWGEPAREPRPGDVIVLPRGHSPGALGGHVGIATGQIADGPNGQSYYMMQSGNLGGKVQYTWEPAKSVVIRRAPQTPPEQAR